MYYSFSVVFVPHVYQTARRRIVIFGKFSILNGITTIPKNTFPRELTVFWCFRFFNSFFLF